MNRCGSLDVPLSVWTVEGPADLVDGLLVELAPTGPVAAIDLPGWAALPLARRAARLFWRTRATHAALTALPDAPRRRTTAYHVTRTTVAAKLAVEQRLGMVAASSWLLRCTGGLDAAAGALRPGGSLVVVGRSEQDAVDIATLIDTSVSPKVTADLDAEARGRVERNVAKLVDPPRGTPGRPSKALDLTRIRALLAASAGKPIGAYIAISALTGIRTEEARPLEWRHLHLNPLKGQQCSCGRVHDHDLPPHVEVWRSVREDGDTKTPKSRRTSALPQLVIDLLRGHQVRQRQWRAVHGWKSVGIVYVFGTRHDTVPHAQVIRIQFRAVVAKAGIAGSWTPRELRHTYVSILSDRGAPIELIADLVGHKDIATTRMVYRHQLRPVITGGAELIDDAVSGWTWDLKGRNIG